MTTSNRSTDHENRIAQLRAGLAQAAADWAFSRVTRNPGRTVCAIHGNPVESCERQARPGITCREHYAQAVL